MMFSQPAKRQKDIFSANRYAGAEWRMTAGVIIFCLVFVSCWVFSPLHFKAKYHVWCSEHQTFEHYENHGLLVSVPVSTASYQRSKFPDNGEQHHQCQILVFMHRAKAEGVTSVSCVIENPALSLEKPVYCCHHYLHIPALVMAPKTSPPVPIFS